MLSSIMISQKPKDSDQPWASPLLDAAIDMLNQMKTFGTADVDVAIDGAGSGRQRKEIK